MAQINAFVTIYAARSIRIGLDDAGIYREAFATAQPFGHASAQDRLEHMAQCVAVAESTVPVLGEGRVIGNPDPPG